MQAVERVLLILGFAASSTSPLSLMEIATGTGIDKSSCSRIVSSLVKKGWLERDDRTRSFIAGPAALQFSYSVIRNPLESRESREVLARLQELSGETVAFLRRVGTSRVRVAGLEGSNPVRHALDLGEVNHLTVGPSGKAILAFLEPNEQEELLASASERSRIITLQQCREVVTKGYLSTDSDNNSESGALVSPVFDRSGIYGSLAIYGPVRRWDAPQRDAFRDELLAGAARITRTLGGDDTRYEGWRREFR